MENSLNSKEDAVGLAAEWTIAERGCSAVSCDEKTASDCPDEVIH